MTTYELLERCNNSNEDLFFEFIHDLNKMSYIFESDKLTYSDIERIRKIVRIYILAFYRIIILNTYFFLNYKKTMIKSLDPLGEVLTKKEIKFLAEIFTDAWYSLDIENMNEEGKSLFISIEQKIKELNNA